MIAFQLQGVAMHTKIFLTLFFFLATMAFAKEELVEEILSETAVADSCWNRVAYAQGNGSSRSSKSFARIAAEQSFSRDISRFRSSCHNIEGCRLSFRTPTPSCSGSDERGWRCRLFTTVSCIKEILEKT